MQEAKGCPSSIKIVSNLRNVLNQGAQSSILRRFIVSTNSGIIIMFSVSLHLYPFFHLQANIPSPVLCHMSSSLVFEFTILCICIY